jgi:hypothetical protein
MLLTCCCYRLEPETNARQQPGRSSQHWSLGCRLDHLHGQPEGLDKAAGAWKSERGMFVQSNHSFEHSRSLDSLLSNLPINYLARVEKEEAPRENLK